MMAELWPLVSFHKGRVLFPWFRIWGEQAHADVNHLLFKFAQTSRLKRTRQRDEYVKTIMEKFDWRWTVFCAIFGYVRVHSWI